MTDIGSSTPKTHRYRFSRPGSIEIEVREFTSDDDAEGYARDHPLAKETPIVIERHDLVDWEYLTEVDERP